MRKNNFTLGSQYNNQGNLFLINLLNSGKRRLNSVKNEVTLKSILTLGCHVASLEILAALENCFHHLWFITTCHQILLKLVTSNVEFSCKFALISVSQMLSTCFLGWNIEKLPKGVALKLRQFCNRYYVQN